MSSESWRNFEEFYEGKDHLVAAFRPWHGTWWHVQATTCSKIKQIMKKATVGKCCIYAAA